MVQEHGSRLNFVRRAALVSLTTTTIVVAGKITAAYYTHSVSILAESMQSLIDVVMSFVALGAISLASRPADETHPFGHGRLEVLSAALQMVIVVFTAGIIAWQAAMRIANPQPIHPDLGIAVMGGAAVTNFIVIAYLQRTDKKHGSASLKGEAQHLRSDTYASIGIIVGLIATKLTNLPVLDPIFAIIFTIGGAIFALRELHALGHQLMDGALPQTELEKVRRVLDNNPNVRGYHKILSRQAGELRVITLHVLLDDDLTFVEAHDMAEEIESLVSQALAGALVTAHYEPYHAEMAHHMKYHQKDT